MQKNLQSDQTGGSQSPSNQPTTEVSPTLKNLLDYPEQKAPENPDEILSQHHKADPYVTEPKVVPENDVYSMISNGSFRGILSFDNGHNAIIPVK